MFGVRNDVRNTRESLEVHFGGSSRKIRVSTSTRSVMSFRVVQNAVVWIPRERWNSDCDSVCSCVWPVHNKLHISHEPCVWRYPFCMTTKSPTLNISDSVPSSVRDFEKPEHTSLPRVFVALLHWHTPEHVSLEFWTFRYPLAGVCQRCGPLVLHAQWQPWWESLKKSLIMHSFKRSTVWCSLLVLKISYSVAATTHKSWSPWRWRHNPSPPPPFWRTIPVDFCGCTLGGKF